MNAEQLAHRLGAVRSGRQWKCRCVAHDDAGPSMILFDGRERLQVRCLAGCETRDVIAALRARGLWEGAHSTEANGASKAQTRTDEADAEAERMRERARRIWDQTIPCDGTRAEDYLAHREIWTVASELPEIVRFHPRCPRGREQAPAVVVAMRGFASNALQAIQRIFLTPDACKDGHPMMLGSAGGAAMKLQRVAGVELHIAEGIETALSVKAMGNGPVWALGSTSGIKALPVFEGVQRLVIWADHDPINPRTGKRPGFDAADVCATRWRGAGRQVQVWFPEKEEWDAADVWSNRCARR
jgi:putative DNA primase/helicase